MISTSFIRCLLFLFFLSLLVNLIFWRWFFFVFRSYNCHLVGDFQKKGFLGQKMMVVEWCCMWPSLIGSLLFFKNSLFLEKFSWNRTSRPYDILRSLNFSRTLFSGCNNCLQSKLEVATSVILRTEKKNPFEAKDADGDWRRVIFHLFGLKKARKFIKTGGHKTYNDLCHMCVVLLRLRNELNY